VNSFLVRHTDPISAYNALLRLNLADRQREAIEILWSLGGPTSAQGVRDESVSQGYSVTVGETHRRRIHQLWEEGRLYQWSVDDGTGMTLWFIPPWQLPSSLNGYTFNRRLMGVLLLLLKRMQ
jgi:hypothetical protein